jgi:hypothetical protein
VFGPRIPLRRVSASTRKNDGIADRHSTFNAVWLVEACCRDSLRTGSGRSCPRHS